MVKYSSKLKAEVGYLPVSHDKANLLFQLINARYERNSTIITVNSEVEKFHDPTIAAAILNQLVHHANVIKTSVNHTD